MFLSPFNRRTIEEKYVEAMKEICGLYSIPFYDNYHASGICFQNAAQKDIYELNGSLHLNEIGQERIALKYENIIKGL